MDIQSGTKNLDYVVHRVMSDMDQVSMKNYQKLLQLSINGFHELNIFSLPQIKTVELKVSNAGTVDLPSDYINYTAIGVCIHGHLWTLGLNNDICLSRAEDCPVELEDAVANTPATQDLISTLPLLYYFSGQFRNGQYVGEQYSIGGGWNKRGYYRIDTEKKQIAFKSVVPQSTIILEYKSSGISCDGTVEVPLSAVSTLVAYVHWQRIEFNPDVPQSDKERKMRQYYTMYNKLRHLNLIFTASEYMDSKNRTIKSTPKR